MTQAYNLSQFANTLNTSGQTALTTGVTGTLPVANGGTNQTTYTDGQLLIGNTTGNTLTKATLTAGSGISVTNGSGSITIASTASGGFQNMQVFTSPGTFTTPASTTKIKITVVGGGGNSNAGQGGGGGGAAIYVGPVTASTPYAVTVGAAAGTSSFSTLASATGGANTGVGGLGSAGTIQIKGGGGGASATYMVSSSPLGTGFGSTSGNGGSSILGGGGNSVVSSSPNSPAPSVAGNAGGNYGGGGSGSNGGGANGAGASGVVVVEY
jgi:hypothetical protein